MFPPHSLKYPSWTVVILVVGLKNKTQNIGVMLVYINVRIHVYMNLSSSLYSCVFACRHTCKQSWIYRECTFSSSVLWKIKTFYADISPPFIASCFVCVCLVYVFMATCTRVLAFFCQQDNILPLAIPEQVVIHWYRAWQCTYCQHRVFCSLWLRHQLEQSHWTVC